MAKQNWKPCSILSPVPAVIVTVRDKEGHDNCLTIAWAGTVCTNPSMVSISVRKERASYPMLRETGEFVINMTTKDMVYATDLVGVKSGRDMDKFAAAGLHKEEAKSVNCCILKESPVSLECRVREVIPLGTHDMFLAEVVSVDVDEAYISEKGTLSLSEADLIAYAHGTYYVLGKKVGTFGYSVRKKQRTNRKM